MGFIGAKNSNTCDGQANRVDINSCRHAKKKKKKKNWFNCLQCTFEWCTVSWRQMVSSNRHGCSFKFSQMKQFNVQRVCRREEEEELDYLYVSFCEMIYLDLKPTNWECLKLSDEFTGQWRSSQLFQTEEGEFRRCYVSVFYILWAHFVYWHEGELVSIHHTSPSVAPDYLPAPSHSACLTF